MMARYWRGRVRARDVDAYVEYVSRTGIAGQRATPGNKGSMMLVRSDGSEAEVVVLSLWESPEAIGQFATGGSLEQAVFYPEDDRYLVAADPTAPHYEVRVYAIEDANDAVPGLAAPSAASTGKTG